MRMQDLAGDTLATVADCWLAEFETALSDGDRVRIAALFYAECYWRDILAFSWDINTLHGVETVASALARFGGSARPTEFKTDHLRTPPRHVTRAGTAAIEAIFRFETALGRGDGVIRLVPDRSDGGKLKAWTLLTALQELKGFEEAVGETRPSGEAYSREFRGANWLDLRNAAVGFEDRDPAVLIVGGGHAGLSIAARLVQLGVDTLVVERNPRIGDNWRNRYHALTLHNQVQVNHLPYMPFPPGWPTYIPKDKLAGWLEAYVEAMEINAWTSTELQAASYDAKAGSWVASLRLGDGTERNLRPRHVVMATGVSCIPSYPDIPALENFSGQVLHASAYDDGESLAGKTALVIGTGNSGHDIAQDLHAAGADVTLVQRSSTLIINIEPSAQLPYALYSEGPPLADCDLITASMPLPLARKAHVQMTEQAKQLDKQLLDGLARVGFRLDFGEDGSGWQFKYLTRGGGYYFNVGCSDLIAQGEIKLMQFDDIADFTSDAASLRSGERLPADLIVLATGYKGQEAQVRQLFGDDVADRVGPIWGFGEEQELRNMFKRTAQPGLWFIAGSLAQCRIYSKFLGLQIKASEEGLITNIPA